MRSSRRTLGLQPELDPVDSSGDEDVERNQSQSPEASQDVSDNHEETRADQSTRSDDVNVNDTDVSMGSDKTSEDDSIVNSIAKS